MAAFWIDEVTSALLDTISANPDFQIKPMIEEELQRLGLLPDTAIPACENEWVEPVAIRNMVLLITQKCNFNCVYCYGDDGTYGSEAEMDIGTARKAVEWLIEQSQESKTLGIAFLGGEPLLNFTLIQNVVSYCQNRTVETGKKFEFSLSTNGFLLDDEKIAFMKEHRVRVTVSFDGQKEVQNTQRRFKNGSGTYDSVLPKIERLLSILPEVVGRATLDGMADPIRAKKAMLAIGFPRVVVKAASPSLFMPECERKNPEWVISRMLEMTESEADKFITSLASRNGKSLRKLRRSYSLIAGEYLECFLSQKKNWHYCGAGRRYVAVSANGDVYLCHRFVGTESYRLGSIFGNSLKRHVYQRSSIMFVKRCINCFAKYICAGGCYYDNVSAGGSAFEPDVSRCRLMRRSVELIAAITCRLSPEEKGYLLDEGIVLKKPCPLDF